MPTCFTLYTTSSHNIIKIKLAELIEHTLIKLTIERVIVFWSVMIKACSTSHGKH